MKAPLDELYFRWLYSLILSPRSKRTYWTLFRQLYKKEFVWIVPRDDNRIEDGRDLRYEFIDEMALRDVDPDWVDLGCSMLELIVVLSRILSFETDISEKEWFWQLLENIDLRGVSTGRYSDQDTFSEEDVNDKLNQVIYRTYSRTGRGGLFPLRYTDHDQRKVELWYQLTEYLIEQEG